MDEYLFITMAKLQADRLRLERERRAEQPAEEPGRQPLEAHKPSAWARWFSRAPQWREQS